ncbi:MAG TPA: family 10 glycosylhydrolase [Limnochordales bacterium]
MSRRRRAVLITAVLLSLAAGFYLGVREGLARVLPVAGGTVAVSGPVRGIWVVRHALASRASIDQVVETARAVGANALFVQVNGRSEAYYRSHLLPPAPGIEPGLDPLAYVLERAGRAGLEVHAWINAYTAGLLAELPASPQHVLNQHPDWVTVDRDGRSLWDYSLEEALVHVPARMLEPGLPAVQDFVYRSVMEVVEGYPVAGVHLDYARYPSRRFGYHPESVQRFAAEHGFDPAAMERDAAAFIRQHGAEEFQRRQALWDNWRKDQVTALVARIRQGIQERRPGMRFTAAVHADVADAVHNRLQDWPAWVRRGLVDAVVPMAYSADTARVARQLQDATALARGTGVAVYAGLAAHLVLDNPQVLAAQLAAAQEAGTDAVVVFSHEPVLQSSGIRAVLSGAWGTSAGSSTR